MKVIADTNVILRYIFDFPEDQLQNELAHQHLSAAQEIIVPTHVWCELVWTLTQTFKMPRSDIYATLKDFLDGFKKVTIQEDEFEWGLRLLQAGGDFADGVNAYTGTLMTHGGGATFLSFDKQAVKLLNQLGYKAEIPA